MPASVISFTTRAPYWLLQAALPGRVPENIGVLLLDGGRHRLHQRLRRDWLSIADAEEYEVLALLADDLERKASELGPEALIEYLENSLSGAIRISEAETVEVHSFPVALERLYQEHVPARVLRFETHLPRYSLQAAAGKFSGHMDVQEEDWVEGPDDLCLTEDMFVAQVMGRSMEPTIPDGSLCVFKYGVVGSRTGRLVLVVNYRETDFGGRYTIKRYRSEKDSPLKKPGKQDKPDEENDELNQEKAEWKNKVVWLEPLNPEYDRWQLDDSGQIAVIAEFICVLKEPD